MDCIQTFGLPFAHWHLQFTFLFDLRASLNRVELRTLSCFIHSSIIMVIAPSNSEPGQRFSEKAIYLYCCLALTIAGVVHLTPGASERRAEPYSTNFLVRHGPRPYLRFHRHHDCCLKHRLELGHTKHLVHIGGTSSVIGGLAPQYG